MATTFFLAGAAFFFAAVAFLAGAFLATTFFLAGAAFFFAAGFFLADAAGFFFVVTMLLSSSFVHNIFGDLKQNFHGID